MKRQISTHHILARSLALAGVIALLLGNTLGTTTTAGPQSPSAPQGFDLVCDDGDGCFSYNGGWNPPSNPNQYCKYSGDMRFGYACWLAADCQPDNDHYSVFWRPYQVPGFIPGNYEVFAYISRCDSATPHTQGARYYLRRSGDSAATAPLIRTVNQAHPYQDNNDCSDGARWASLGTHYFDSGTYIELRAWTDESGPQWGTRHHVIFADAIKFSFRNQPPNVPQQASPADGSTADNPSVTLVVQDRGDPDNYPWTYRDYYYRIEKTDGSWSQERGWTTDTSWTVTVPSAGTYRWRVQAGDGELPSGWTGWWTFSYNEITPDTIVDDGDPGFSFNGSWNPPSNPNQYCKYSGDMRFGYACYISSNCRSDTDAYSVFWRPSLPQSGSYEVFVYIPKCDSVTPHTQSAKYYLRNPGDTPASAPLIATVNQASTQGQACSGGAPTQVSLGTHYFNAGTYIELRAWTDESAANWGHKHHVIFADAMRFHYVEGSPPPTPTPTPPPPPPGNIVEAARAEIGMPYCSDWQYSANRHTFCGDWGPWRSQRGVCSDVVIDAYLAGTSGQAQPFPCGVGQWWAFIHTSGGANLINLVQADYQRHHERYPRRGNGRSAEDMRIYFVYNQAYLGKNEAWQPGDVAFFDWEGDGWSDHVGIIAAVGSQGMPTRMVHSPGCTGSHCSCPGFQACEVNWHAGYQASAMGHGRLNATGLMLHTAGESEVEVDSLRITLTSTDTTPLAMTLYNSAGHYAAKEMNPDIVANNNDRFIPYIPYNIYDVQADAQTLTLYSPLTGTYRLLIAAEAAQTYDLQIATYKGDQAISSQTFTGHPIAANESQTSLILLHYDGADLLAESTTLSGSAHVELPVVIGAEVTVGQSVTLTWRITETGGYQPVGTLALRAEPFSLPTGQPLDIQSVTFSPSPVLGAGQTATLHAQLSIPSSSQGGIYYGAFNIKGTTGQNWTLPVQLTVLDRWWAIYLPLILRSP